MAERRSGAGRTGAVRFRFEDDDVFQIALEIASVADTVAMRVRRDRPWAASQLGRSSLSILNNAAEGQGEYSPDDKARFYRYASRSATEAAATLTFMRGKGLVDPELDHRLRALILRAITALTRRAIHFRTLATRESPASEASPPRP